MKLGFSLIELMIVLAIIGILAALAIPKYVEWRKANVAASEQVKRAPATDDVKRLQ